MKFSSFQNPAISDVYTEHSCAVNVAKYSPSGFYIASAGKKNQATLTDRSYLISSISCIFFLFPFLDQSGKVRIWDTVNKEHILKNEFQPITGPIKDLAWSPDNQRMVVVGEGREKSVENFSSTR